VLGGETVIREGEPGDCLYIVLSGRLRVSLQRADGRDEVVGEIARGESVGEMAVLTGGTRTASVRAIRDSQLLRLSKVGFDRLVERAPGTAMKLARMLVLRLQNTTHRRTRGGAPADRAAARERRSCRSPHLRDLVRSFAAVGSTDLIDRDTVDAALGPGAAETGGESGSGLAAWLDERERSVQFSLFAADSATSAWGGQCVRQVDRVLIAVRAGTRPDIGQIETAASSTGAPKEIVILHEAGTVAPRDTGQILSGIRRSGMHHQVRLGNAADMGRLVRLLSGRGIGVVLGGGGARAFAHLGVLRALREAGVPIALSGGTCWGAVMPAQYAIGWDDETIMRKTRQAFVDSGSLFDYTVPLMALIDGRRFVRTLEHIFGQTQIEDLWLKYFCVSTNLTRADQVVHETGLLARWLCASISVPGLAPPVFYRGNLLVDGSVLNTVPADVMRGFGRGPVIAVDVTARVDTGVDPELRDTPTSWQLVRNRLNPIAKRLHVPSLYKILLRTSMLSSVQSVERLRGSVDLYIHPPVEQFELLDWKSFDRIVELGYDAGREAVEGWTGNRPESGGRD
jgi:predicted acylesterase/phospholipase RssA